LRHGDAVHVATVDPAGHWVVTAAKDTNVRLWRAPAPLEAALPQVVLLAQVLTGMELDPGGGERVLDARAWQQRRDCLQQGDDLSSH
jgi:hypothetical protein